MVAVYTVRLAGGQVIVQPCFRITQGRLHADNPHDAAAMFRAQAAERRAEAQKIFDKAVAELDKAIDICRAAERWSMCLRKTDAAVCLEVLAGPWPHAQVFKDHHAACQPCGRWVFPDGSEIERAGDGWQEVP